MRHRQSLLLISARRSVELNGPVPMDAPYPIAPVECVSDTAAIFAGESRVRVGLIWAGNRVYVNDAFRSTHLRDWVALAEEQRVCLYSLQKTNHPWRCSMCPNCLWRSLRIIWIL